MTILAMVHYTLSINTCSYAKYLTFLHLAFLLQIYAPIGVLIYIFKMAKCVNPD